MPTAEAIARTRDHPIARGEAPFPPGPWTWHGCEIFQVRVQLPEAALTLLPPSLTPAEGRTGGFSVYTAPEGWALAPFTSWTAWIDVEGYDSLNGTKGRFLKIACWSGIVAPVLYRTFSKDCLFGFGWIDETDDLIRCGGGPVQGTDYLRCTMRRPTGERMGMGLTRYLLGEDHDGRVNVHATPVSGDFWETEFVSLHILAPPSHPLALMKPEKIIGCNVGRKVSMTCGVIFDRPRPEPEPQSADRIIGLIRNGAILLQGRRVVGLNQAAKDLLDDGLVLRQGELRASLSADQPHLDAILLGAERGGPAAARDVAALRRPSGRKPLLVRAAPVEPDQTGRKSIVLLIADPERSTVSDPAPALQLLGLTPGEARIASLVGSGLSPRDAAETLDRTEGTVRVVLKSVYAKLDIGRQSELAHLVRNLEYAT